MRLNDSRSQRNQLGKLIKNARNKNNLTQKYVARELGLSSAQSIYNIEKGVSTIPLKHISKLCKTLELDEYDVYELVLENWNQSLRKELGISSKKKLSLVREKIS